MTLIELIIVSLVLGTNPLLWIYKNKITFKIHLLSIVGLYSAVNLLMMLIGFGFGVMLQHLLTGIQNMLTPALFIMVGFKLIMNAAGIRKSPELEIDSFKNMLFFFFAGSVDAMIGGLGFGLIDVPLNRLIAVFAGLSFLSILSGLVVNRSGNTLNILRTGIIIGVAGIGVGVKLLLELFEVLG